MTAIRALRDVSVRRVVLISLTGLFVLLAAIEAVDLGRGFIADREVAQDWAFYAGLGRHWLETGAIYGDRQLTGLPYHVLINVDNLYPPPAILLFAPFGFLPEPISALAWWSVPTAVVVLSLIRCRPAMWTWPILAFGLAWPRTIGSFYVGNTDLWSAGFVAGGLLWGWPGVFGALKPAFGPLFLVGARRRSWWVAAVGLAVASLLLAAYWPQYLTAATHWDLPLDRGLPNIVLPLLPLVAWIGRTRPVTGRGASGERGAAGST